MPKPATHPCPKCKRPLKACGEVEVDAGAKLPVYQCGECIIDWHFGGETFPTSLTFAVDAKGRILDPESLEPIDPASYRAK